MENAKRVSNELQRRKRKVMVLLPVVVIPLLTMSFYALGGGTVGGNGVVLTKGLNMSLPEAKFDAKKKGLNKLGFYMQSDQDSIKLRERRKMDPYYGWKDSAAFGLRAGVVNGGAVADVAHRDIPTGLKMEAAPTDLQAAELMRKLGSLKDVLGREQQGVVPEMPLVGRGVEAPYPVVRSSPGSVLAVGSETARMGSVVPWGSAGSGTGSGSPLVQGTSRLGQGDPDLDKLNSIMEKVLRVRYPGDATPHDSMPAGLGGPPVQVLTTPQPLDVMTTLAVADKDDLETGFIDLDEGPRADSLAEYTIPAVVDGAQTLISGEAVTLRTAGDAMLGGMRVPYGTALSGRATLSGERLLISVNAVRVGSRVIPVALDVVDMDGMTGIRVQGSINRDVSKESADEAVGSMGLTTMDASVAGQATAAGIQTAKNLLSRKIRLVRVGLPAGYRVLLRNTKVNH